jgi:hypothetical protein
LACMMATRRLLLEAVTCSTTAWRRLSLVVQLLGGGCPLACSTTARRRLLYNGLEDAVTICLACTMARSEKAVLLNGYG